LKRDLRGSSEEVEVEVEDGMAIGRVGFLAEGEAEDEGVVVGMIAEDWLVVERWRRLDEDGETRPVLVLVGIGSESERVRWIWFGWDGLSWLTTLVGV
jgi:hypothetical protein